jgi:hypothetical protein
MGLFGGLFGGGNTTTVTENKTTVNVGTEVTLSLDKNLFEPIKDLYGQVGRDVNNTLNASQRYLQDMRRTVSFTPVGGASGSWEPEKPDGVTVSSSLLLPVVIGVAVALILRRIK